MKEDDAGQVKGDELNNDNMQFKVKSADGGGTHDQQQKTLNMKEKKQ